MNIYWIYDSIYIVLVYLGYKISNKNGIKSKITENVNNNEMIRVSEEFFTPWTLAIWLQLDDDCLQLELLTILLIVH